MRTLKIIEHISLDGVSQVSGDGADIDATRQRKSNGLGLVHPTVVIQSV